eukprot:GILJ01004608.1.p1 GENE.GILJ01004608.1~~GILJ01004608.1.p1  ORF type:complete len:562 (-),score=83.28 GILJ01004608.1:168-1853(-)
MNDTSRREEVPADFLAKQTPLSRHSDEWARIEYLLQLSARTTAVKVTNVWSIGNPHLTMQFEKRTQNMLTLDSWVDVTRLGEDNGVQEVCQRGFKFPPSGLLFSSGNVSVNSHGEDSRNTEVNQLLSRVRLGAGGRRPFEYLLCKIGVGRSYCLEESTPPTDKIAIPPGYESIYLHRAENETGAEGEVVGKSYKHDYILFDSPQVLPCFLVNFEYDPAMEEKMKAPRCDVCEEAIATVYCTADNARLCADCDEETHSHNKLVSRHIRVPVSEQPKSFGVCSTHPDVTVEFFCPTCHVPVCVHCKMVGTHSAGEAASHKLIGIADAYKGALSASQKMDPLLDRRRTTVKEQLRLIDDRLREVNKNSSAVEEKIYQILQEALYQLQDETQKKMSVLLGEELELRRQLEQIEWLESFLRFQQQALPPVDFLTSWSRHCQLRSELHNLNTIRTEINVFPDIRLEGRIQVVNESQTRDRSFMGKSPKVDVKTEQSASSRSPAPASTSFRANLFQRHMSSGLDMPSVNPALGASLASSMTKPSFHYDSASAEEAAYIKRPTTVQGML